MIRVLVIDDDPGIRRAIRYALSDEGYQIDEAQDGRAALAAIARRHPDLILLDMKMPGVDGWEFARRYRERYNHRAPIIVLTAAQDAGRRAASIDADGYLAKPFDLDALIERVSATAKQRQPNADLPQPSRACDDS